MSSAGVAMMAEDQFSRSKEVFAGQDTRQSSEDGMILLHSGKEIDAD